MAASLIIVAGNRDIDSHRSLPSVSLPVRTAAVNCASVQLPIPAVFENVMFGPSEPAAFSPWQVPQPIFGFDQTAAPFTGSAAVGDEPALEEPAVDEEPPVPGEPALPPGDSGSLLQAVARAATAAANRQTCAKLCRVLNAKSLLRNQDRVDLRGSTLYQRAPPQTINSTGNALVSTAFELEPVQREVARPSRAGRFPLEATRVAPPSTNAVPTNSVAETASCSTK
jgi:hypothetical protein